MTRAPTGEMASEMKRSSNFLEDEDRPGFFKDYHFSVRKALSNDQFQEFSRLSSDEARVRFLFKLPAVHDIDIRPFYKGKSEREALERKEAGNRAFMRKNNLDAFQLYSQAVVKAPVPSEENADPKKMTLYAICLANRSAALFHLKDYYHCINDIDEALSHHYPKDLKYKLYKRKGRLLLSFRRHQDALESFRQALKWLDWAKMDRERRIEIQSDIQRWLRLFEGAKVIKNFPWEAFEQHPNVPELAGGANEKFPAFSKKVAVEHSKKSGRYAVAADDILPGDCLCVESPYASVLLYEQYGTHCQSCFALTKAPIPCKTCSGVLFCSSECRDSAYFHKVECLILDLLHGSGMSINCFLALRMLTQTPLSFFMSLRDCLVDEDPKEILDNFNPYLGSDFLRVFNLVRHEHSRTQEDYLHRALMAVFLVKALKKTKYFIDYASTTLFNGKYFRAETFNEAEMFAGALLLRFLQIVQFNAHEVSEYVLKGPSNPEGAQNESLGAAIYPTLALSNHSCHSAQVRFFSGNRVVTKAIRPLARGDIIPENYGPSFATKTKSARKSELADRYWFECSCEACENNWPMYSEMKHDVLKFKCHKCQAAIEVNLNSTIPFFKCHKCGDQTNILGALKNLQNSEETFKAACKELQEFKFASAEELLITNLNQLNSSLHPPYRDYHLIQEAIMRCGLLAGNRRVKTNSQQLSNGNA